MMTIFCKVRTDVNGIHQNYLLCSLGLLIYLIPLSPVMNHFSSHALFAVVTVCLRDYYSLSFTVSFVSIIHFGATILYSTGNITLLFVDDIIQPA